MQRDPYRLIHKAIRKRLFECAMLLGATDLESAEALSTLRQQLGGMFMFLSHHAEHEEKVIQPLLAGKASAELEALAREHRQIDEATARFKAAVDALPAGDGHAVYLQCCDLVARYLDHTLREETVVLEALRRHLSDAEFLALVRADYGSEVPEAMAPMLKRIQSAFNPADLRKLYQEMALVMSPEAFARLCELTGWREGRS
jgi:hypothetical protein